MNYLTIKQIMKKYHFPYTTVLDWIKKGKLTKHQNFLNRQRSEIYIDEDEILEIPTFIRRRYTKNHEKT